ncbi:MAG: Crp/Fnr family transcriptional regulator [Cyclobacteriaceae bacterium]|nr:Crp/Fnr family transcriptional regulator [Cytophagales bacterium]MBX2899402.1 Crp/Fnr family transcriptional regulator [Cyclobacteriaceae bacterium]
MAKVEFNIACSLCEHLKDSLFNGLSPEDLSRINNHKTCVQYKKGQNIFYEGTRPTGLYCMNAGKVKVYKNNVQGKEFIIYIAKPGDFLGYRALLSEEFYQATATVLEDAKICFIPKENFFEVLQKNPAFMKRVVKAVCHEMGIMEDKLAELAHKSVRERLAANLLMLKETYGMEGEGSSLIDLALSREDLASIVGTATETVIRLLSDFKSDGLIAFEGKKIRVLDAKKLARQADLIVA